MPRQLKAGPFHVKQIDGRTVTGIFSVLGNLDDYDDRIWPGAFTKTFAERGKKILHLWQHDFCAPPIAVISGLRELTRDELPPAVLAEAPEALGGAEVVREYLPTPRGDEVLAALMAGSPLQMSFAYDAIRYDYEAKPDAKYEWERIRNLREVRLWETSDVLWGANQATVASKAAMPFEFLIKQLGIYLDELREGGATKESRRNSGADQDRINTIATLAYELGATNITLVGEAEPEGEDAKHAPAITENPDGTKTIMLDGMTYVVSLLTAPTKTEDREASSRAAEDDSAPTALAYRRMQLELRRRELLLGRV